MSELGNQDVPKSGLIMQTNGNGAASDTDPVPEWMTTMLQSIGKYIQHQVAPLRRRIDELEGRMENFKYCGVYESGTVYQRGNFVTHHGSLWHCESDTIVTPGKGDPAWKLCVKRGKDGRGGMA